MALLYQRLLSEFPQTGLRSAFAYGSCVYKQIGQACGMSDMIDFIFIVDNPSSWHNENLLKHPSHYSFLKYGGGNMINCIQNKTPNVYFNTLIRMENQVIKYGVISTQSFIDDLTHWNHLYISGRLHKPVCWIRENISESDVLECLDKSILQSRKQNLEQVVSIALLLLPETFSEEELFLRICKISYDGDFRMLFGEDKSKVERIVWGHENDFRRLYSPILNEIAQVDWKSAYSNLLMRDCSLEGQKVLAKRIPSNVLNVIRHHYGVVAKSQPDSWVIERIVEQPRQQSLIESALKSIVTRSSLRQTFWSFLTAGLNKSITYGCRKLWKMVASSKMWLAGHRASLHTTRVSIPPVSENRIAIYLWIINCSRAQWGERFRGIFSR